MSNSAGPPASPGLLIARAPGDSGPIVRCSGELTLATAEALRRELGLLISLSPTALILNISGCRNIDVDGIVVLLEACRQLRNADHHLIVVAGSDPATLILRELGIDMMVAVFPTEGAAALALRGGGPPAVPPATWMEARAEVLAHWRAIFAGLQDRPAAEALHQITCAHGICRRADAIRRERNASENSRCEVCPLFQELGGRTEDIGCRSITQPVLSALLVGDRDAARHQIIRVIELIEQIPLPTE